MSKFILSSDVLREQLDWGEIGWVANPPTTEAQDITVMEVTLNVGAGHNFHKHPDQEEVIYVIAGQIEQWLEQEKAILNPGDSIFIKRDVVHASFNIGDDPAVLMVVLGSSIGEIGYEVVDVADEEPWKSLR